MYGGMVPLLWLLFIDTRMVFIGGGAVVPSPAQFGQCCAMLGLLYYFFPDPLAVYQRPMAHPSSFRPGTKKTLPQFRPSRQTRALLLSLVLLFTDYNYNYFIYFFLFITQG